MQYMGGKGRVAAPLSRAILEHAQGRKRYLEPFVGSAFVTERVAQHFGNVHCSDTQEDLILMWQALQDGWLPPDEVSRELYQDLRHAAPSALRGFVGFGCSFGGKWFRGYASDNNGRDYCGAAKRGVLRKAATMRHASFEVADYRSYSPDSDDVVYCDPPYAGTTAFSGPAVFDHEDFWATAGKWSANGACVLVSEYNAPDGVDVVWQKNALQSLRHRGNNHPVIEKLYRV